MLLVVVPWLFVLAGSDDAQLVQVTWSRRLNAGTGAPELEVELSIPGSPLRLHLWHNRELLPTSAEHVLHFRNRREVIPLPENCFYIGEVLEEASRVAMSTCGGGLSGMIFRHNQTLRLDPDQAAHASNRKLAGSGSHWLRTLGGEPKLQSVQRFLRSSPTRRLSSLTKYVEVLAVNDFSRYSSFGGQSGLQALAAHTVAMLNAVTTIYRAAPTAGAFPYPVQVVLVGQHTFLEEDPWQAKFQDNAEADQKPHKTLKTNMGKVHGSLARAGKVRNQTPKVAKQEKKKKPVGRAKKRLQYNKRFINAVVGPGGRRPKPNTQPAGKLG